MKLKIYGVLLFFVLSLNFNIATAVWAGLGFQIVIFRRKREKV